MISKPKPSDLDKTRQRLVFLKAHVRPTLASTFPVDCPVSSNALLVIRCCYTPRRPLEQSCGSGAATYGSAEGSKSVPNSGWLRAFAVGCSNFSIQYNYQCASIAMAIMATHRDLYVSDPAAADFPAAPWVHKTLLAVVFAGSVAGMLFMGLLGDFIGHRRALLLTKALVVLGAFSCILLPAEASDNFWKHLALWRFIIGVGLGGAYPLTAAVAGRSDEVGQAFFWQTPGLVAPYVVALILVALLPGATGTQFRWILGLGAVPSVVALLASLQGPEGSVRGSGDSLIEGFRQALSCRQLQRRLIGTAGSWFLFDVAAYGTVVFTPHILSVFGKEQLSCSIPATWLSVMALPILGAKKLNLYGFVLQAALFAAFASSYSILNESRKVLIALLCAIYFGLNWGVCVSTYVLPIEVFPEEFRGTLHGVSAASGKLGALVGAALFPFLNAAAGVPAVMGLQAIVCGLGACLLHMELVLLVVVGWCSQIRFLHIPALKEAVLEPSLVVVEKRIIQNSSNAATPPAFN
eukprot:s2331_g4.t1